MEEHCSTSKAKRKCLVVVAKAKWNRYFLSVRNVVIFASFFYIVVAFHFTCLALCAVRWQGIVKRKAYRARYYIACKASRSTRRISSAFCFYFGKFPITYQRVEVTIVLPFFVGTFISSCCRLFLKRKISSLSFISYFIEAVPPLFPLGESSATVAFITPLLVV